MWTFEVYTVSQRDVILVSHLNTLWPILIKKHEIDLLACFGLPIKEIRDRRQTGIYEWASPQEMAAHNAFNQRGVFNP